MISNWLSLLFWIAYVYSGLWSLSYVEKNFEGSARLAWLRAAALAGGPILPLVCLCRQLWVKWSPQLVKKFNPGAFQGIRFFDLDGNLLPQPEDAALFQLRNLIVAARTFRAHEIYLVFGESCSIRLRRKNGSRTLPVPDKKFAEAMLAAIRSLAAFDSETPSAIAEGVFTVQLNDFFSTWFVNSTVTTSGETLTIQPCPACPGSCLKEDLATLGMTESLRGRTRRLLKTPTGLLLLLAPQDQGGTTTAATLAREALLRYQRRGVILSEQAESETPGIMQIESAASPGVPASELVRNALHLDVSILTLLLPEDPATIAAALEAAEERLVILRLKTSDPLTAFRKVIAAAPSGQVFAKLLKGVIMERLTDAVCPVCGTPSPLPAAYGSYFAAAGLKSQELLQRSKNGCRLCRHTGYYGRLPIFAVFGPHEPLARALCGDEKRLDALFKQEIGLPLLTYEGYALAAQKKITLQDAESAVTGR